MLQSGYHSWAGDTMMSVIWVNPNLEFKHSFDLVDHPIYACGLARESVAILKMTDVKGRVQKVIIPEDKATDRMFYEWVEEFINALVAQPLELSEFVVGRHPWVRDKYDVLQFHGDEFGHIRSDLCITLVMDDVSYEGLKDLG